MPPSHTTSESASASAQMQPAPVHLLRGPIIVASDGSDASLPALEMAKLLAADGRAVEVLSIVEPIPAVMPAMEVPLYLPDVDDARRAGTLRLVRDQADTILGDMHPAVDAIVGRPVEEIARRAHARHASLVITGLRHHGRADRLLLRGETPLGIARVARTPVLVVPTRVTRLPRTALIATDLDETSVNAARAARPLLAEVEKVYVVHVRRLGMSPTDESWEHLQAKLASENYGRIVAAMELPSSVSVETRTLTGHPVAELLEFAEFARAELIVTGYRKRLLFDRMAGPRSIAERVFRGTPCTMLLVPETAVFTASSTADAEVEVVAGPDSWGPQLAAFTRRNAGRAAHLEIDTTDIGAQAQVVGFAFTGVDYETTSDSVHLMFGDLEKGTSHLTHSIRHPEAVELQRRRDGKDLALRVGHQGGYSLLTFADTLDPHARTAT